jgi:serine/threonine-protein kinase
MRQKRPDLELPAQLDEVVMKCLKKRINDRPKSAEELEAMLSAIPLEGLPTTYDRRRRAPAPTPIATIDDSNGTLPAFHSEPPPPKT